MSWDGEGTGTPQGRESLRRQGLPERATEEERELWNALDSLSPPPSDAAVPRAEALIARWSGVGSSRQGRGERRQLARVLLAAAAVLVVFAGGWGAARIAVQPAPVALDAGFAELATGSDLATVRLSDGTFVRVAAGSLIRFHEASDRREVWLDGQAFFAVASDPDRPFRVRSAGGEAEALGTRFDYRSVGDEVRLIVVDGRVALSSGGSRVEVGAGEMRGVRAAEISERSEVPDLYGALAWMGRSLVFQSTPLDAVARELTGRYGIPVRLTESALSERTVTAWFTDQEFEEVFTAICRAVDADCSHSAEGAAIAPRTIGTRLGH